MLPALSASPGLGDFDVFGARLPDLRESVEVRGEFMDGRTSFFCLEAGRISSRSTGTPRETRKSRLIRERIQSGGCRGGGATSCDHKEAERGVRKMGLSLEGGTMGEVSSSPPAVVGKRALRYGSVVLIMSSGSSPSKSGIGYRGR